MRVDPVVGMCVDADQGTSVCVVTDFFSLHGRELAVVGRCNTCMRQRNGWMYRGGRGKHVVSRGAEAEACFDKGRVEGALLR